MRTTLYINNIHCQSCVDSINEILSAVPPPPSNDGAEKVGPIISDINISITEHRVSFDHPPSFQSKSLHKQLDIAGFDVASPTSRSLEEASPAGPASKPSRWRRWFTRSSSSKRTSRDIQRDKIHKERCKACRAPQRKSVSDVVSVTSTTTTQSLHKTRFTVGGMTCSSCVSTISERLLPPSVAGIHSCEVTLLPPSAVILHDTNIISADGIKEIVEDMGYDAEPVSSEKMSAEAAEGAAKRAPTSYKVIYSVLGMTCASCVSTVTSTAEAIEGTTAVSVDLMGNTASAVVKHREDAEIVRSEIEDAGYECAVMEIIERYDTEQAASEKRTVNVKVDGMSSIDCINKVNKSLETMSQEHALTFSEISLANPTVSLTYIPEPPSFTLRHIRDEISSLGFNLSVVHIDSVEERAARAHAREQRHILTLLAITFIVAVPTFIVAVVGMSLLRKTNSFRADLERPAWGNASRATVILFALATPVQVGVGWYFYKRAWKSLRGVWRKRRAGANWRKVWIERLFRWGSMDSLVSLGTSAGYLASLALMVLDIRTAPQGMMGGEMGWFDSSIFLMLFILAGRYLEAASKQRTSDAISALSSTKPSTGMLFNSTGSASVEEPADYLEVGDNLLVPVGASPPLDAVLVASSPQTTFDESSLTGESRPTLKVPGDSVYAGTTNSGPAAIVVTVTRESGKTMLDGIVGVVRDAMGKKAGIERIADIVTGYFVPCVVGVAALTFGIWCLRGYLGDLPSDWLDSGRKGGWALFAIQFGVAVLVVACPCGIGLAAPTAQLVGVGLAAQNGILSNGGGEAFQTISSMNTVILDKTGTLTTGKFAVSDYRLLVDSSSHDLVRSLIVAAEQASTHPLAVGVREWCTSQMSSTEEQPPPVDLVSSEEIPGRGLLATLVVDGHKLEVAIGNERLMQDMNSAYESEEASAQATSELRRWQTSGKSVIILSAKFVLESSTAKPLNLPINSDNHSVLGLLGLQDPPRPEASTLVAELRNMHMEVWMISGDNEATARTVARNVGIDESHVIAEALPVDKQKWVAKLQAGSGGQEKARETSGNIVAFCGDGINDAPAIAQANIGLAMGGGSNVALSTADFTLLTSNLLAILTMYTLARATRRKIISNFVWACVYNVTLMPLAAGAFYSLGRTRLPPVWGAAAMALSSVSVVVNSLFLRWTYRPPRAVREWNQV